MVSKKGYECLASDMGGFRARHYVCPYCGRPFRPVGIPVRRAGRRERDPSERSRSSVVGLGVVIFLAMVKESFQKRHFTCTANISFVFGVL